MNKGVKKFSSIYGEAARVNEIVLFTVANCQGIAVMWMDKGGEGAWLKGYVKGDEHGMCGIKRETWKKNWHPQEKSYVRGK